jgi:DNA replication and repair protein RecF
MISPSDVELINGGSEVRRKFIDSIISQYDKVYLEKLIAYNHVLSQRNALLKQFKQNQFFDETTLELWDEQLVFHGSGILQKRLEFLRDFAPLFLKYYKFIAVSGEQVELYYESSIGDKDYKTALSNAIVKDRILEHTTIGIHRDDIDFKLNGNSLKKFASQGQQKSYLLSLKLAQYEFIKKNKNFPPLLLLDDIYDKLDEERFSKLINLVAGDEFGQVFITDTHKDRIKEVFSNKKINAKLFYVEHGEITEIE